MTNITLIVIGLSWLMIVVLYLCFSTYKSKYDSAMLKIAELKYTLSETQKENSLLKEAGKIKSKLEKETNEKITAITNGDLSPDDVLPK
mgnify:CR=1 FL=1